MGGSMPTGAAASRFAIRYGLVRGALDTQAVFDGLYASSPASFWLDSNQAGRFSFLGDDRGPLSETLIGRGGTVTVRDRQGDRVEPGEVFAVLDARLAERRIAATSLPFDFVGGYVGYASVARGSGVVAAGQPPEAMWLFADRIVAVDHEAELSYVLAVEDGRIGIRAAADAWIVETMRSLVSYRLAAAGAQPTRSALGAPLSAGRLQDHYRRLRRSSPAPYAALLSFGEVSLASWASGSVSRTGGSDCPVAAAPATGRPEPGTEVGSVPVSTAACLRRCLLAAMVAGLADEPAPGFAAGPDPAHRPTGLGYFGLAGGLDLSPVTPAAVPRAAVAASRHPDHAPAGVAEPAA